MKYVPLETRRDPRLGRYAGTRAEWKIAYRAARVAKKANPKDTGLAWKAGLIAEFDRHGGDCLSFPVAGRLAALRLVRKILAERPE